MSKSGEHQELKESVDQALERVHHAEGEGAFPPWTRTLSLTTAVIAVLTAISSLGGEYLSHHALLQKNDMVYSQAKASDQWAFFQFKGLRRMVAAGFADTSAKTDPALARRYWGESEQIAREQADVKMAAEAAEADIEKFNRESEISMHYHHDFSIAVTLFQVAIALSAIAALVWRRSLWLAGLGVAGIGIVFLMKGAFFFL